MKLISFELEKTVGWIRIRKWGTGIHYKLIKKHPLYLSETNGFMKGVTIFGWRIRILDYLYWNHFTSKTIRNICRKIKTIKQKLKDETNSSRK